MVTNGDMLIVTKDVMNVMKEGDTAKVIDVADNGIVSFAFGEGFIHKGIMSLDELDEHFEKVVLSPPTVTEDVVNSILENSEFEVMTVFDKCTVVSCKLPNGFVIVESSACVDPDNYDEDMGIDICIGKIRDKIWELEGYNLQQMLYELRDCDGDCDNCECAEYSDCDECDECEDEADEEYNCDNCGMRFECGYYRNL